MCLLGGKSPSVKLMSRRENKEFAKTNLKNMDRTMQELLHIGPKIIKVQTLTTKELQRTANEYAEERRIFKDLISKNNNVDILNSPNRILQC